MADRSEQANATVAFTLPIACSVCLGKVKQPVLCPNNHVFCRSCMDVWLLRNQQCPACRVEITPDNPCRPVIGGLAHQESDVKFSNPELRKARFDLLYKEYEEEIERLEVRIKTYKKENKELRSKLDQSNAVGDSKSSPGLVKQRRENGDLDTRKKLKEAVAGNEKLKKEIIKLKQENNQLKDGNVDLTHENQRLRVEIANRSPQRYGRYTMAALQTKVDSYEKDIKKLQRALERSDEYVEELQEENERLKRGEVVTPKDRTEHNRKQDLELSCDQSPIRKDVVDSSGVKRKLDLDNPTFEADGKIMSPSKRSNVSFDLEFPSPSTPTQRINKMSIEGTPDAHKSSPSDQTRKESHVPILVACPIKNNASNVPSETPESLPKPHTNLENCYPCVTDEGNTTTAIHNELQTLDISITPEISECMKLFNRAEKNISANDAKWRNNSRAAKFQGKSAQNDSWTRSCDNVNDKWQWASDPSSREMGESGGISSRPHMPEFNHVLKNSEKPKSQRRLDNLKTIKERSRRSAKSSSNFNFGFTDVLENSKTFTSTSCKTEHSNLSMLNYSCSSQVSDGVAHDTSTQEFEDCVKHLGEAKRKVAARKESMAYFESVLNYDGQTDRDSQAYYKHAVSDQCEDTDVARFQKVIEDSKSLMGQCRRPSSAFDVPVSMYKRDSSSKRPNSAPENFAAPPNQQFWQSKPRIIFPDTTYNTGLRSLVGAGQQHIGSFLSDYAVRPQSHSHIPGHMSGSVGSVGVAEASSSGSSQACDQIQSQFKSKLVNTNTSANRFAQKSFYNFRQPVNVPDTRAYQSGGPPPT